MKFATVCGLGLAAGSLGAAAHAQDAATSTVRPAGAYVSFTGGAISGTDYSYTVEDTFPVRGEMGDGFVIEAAWGLHFPDNWRGEIAASWRDHNNATTTWQFGANRTGPGVSAYTLDAIAYRDFPINAQAGFYVGGGLGIANVTVDDGVVTDSTGFGLQLQAIAGIDANVRDNVKVFAEVRLRQMRPEIEGGTAGAQGEVRDDFDLTSTSIQAGFRILL